MGEIPPLAAAFQPRTAVRKVVVQARAESKGVVLSQVLTGDGGVGKSQLAASLARELRDQERSEGRGLDLLVWVKATEPDQIIATYAETAAMLQLPGSTSDDSTAAARAFLAWLTTTERRWLVVLDDITDPEAIEGWWPDGNRNGWVLATTRRRDALLSGQGRKLIDVDLYTPQEACSYLHRRLTDADQLHLYNTDHADQLADELGYLPLAIGHAAAYMINKRLPVADYLTLFRNRRTRLSDLLPPSADTEGYGRPVTTTLLLTLEEVETTDTTRLARPLLELISLVDPAGHPAELWTTPPALRHLRTARRSQRRRLRRHSPNVTRHEIHDALDRLRTYALITQETAEAPIRIHALTARAVRETIPARNLRRTAHTAADALLGLWPEFDHQDKELSAALRSNTVQLDQHTRPALWQGGPHRCISRVSISLTAAGLYTQALAYDQKSVKHSTDILGHDHPDTLAARKNLAISYSDAGRHQEALHLNEQVLADRERILGHKHPDTVGARHNLANSYRNTGRIQDALELLTSAVEDYERILGPNHPDTLNARNDLANCYSDAGRHQEALDLREQVLADREQVLGHDHLDTLAARHNLANSYRDTGRHQEALDLRKQILTDRERTLGPNHPDTLTARNNLAISYSHAGQVQDTLHLCERTLADRVRVLGNDHPHALEARHNLANSYSDAGRHQEALDLREQVVRDYERVLGHDHLATLAARHNLANSYRNAGRHQEALHLRKQILTDRERILGPNHPDTLTARYALATSYIKVGRDQEAFDLAEQALANSDDLAGSYRNAGSHQEALDLRKQILTDRERTLGPNHPDTLTARYTLATSYIKVGRDQEAFDLAEQALADRERTLGKNHPAILEARRQLAQARNVDRAAQKSGAEPSAGAPDDQHTPDASERLE